MGKVAVVRARIARSAKLISKTFDLRDLFVFSGVACVVYGGNVLYPGAGWFIAGAGLFWLGTRGT